MKIKIPTIPLISICTESGLNQKYTDPGGRESDLQDRKAVNNGKHSSRPGGRESDLQDNRKVANNGKDGSRSGKRESNLEDNRKALNIDSKAYRPDERVHD